MKNAPAQAGAFLNCALAYLGKGRSAAWLAPDTFSGNKTIKPNAGVFAISPLTATVAVPVPFTGTAGAPLNVMAGVKALKLPIPGICWPKPLVP